MFKRNGVINMGKERYSILFSSMTGNTKELADAIREILPEETLEEFIQQLITRIEEDQKRIG